MRGGARRHLRRDDVPPPRHQARVRTGFLLLVATGLIWGTIGVVGRMIFDRTELKALEGSWLRPLFAAPASLWFGLTMLGRRLFQVPARDLAIMGFLACCIYAFQFLYLIGVDEIGVAVATLICLCSIPVMVALASVMLYGEHP